MAFRFEEKSYRSTFYELSIRSKAKDLLDMFSSDINTFIMLFNDNIKSIERRSSGYAHNFYKAIPSADKQHAEIWHLDIQGDKKRLVANIYPIT